MAALEGTEAGLWLERPVGGGFAEGGTLEVARGSRARFSVCLRRCLELVSATSQFHEFGGVGLRHRTTFRTITTCFFKRPKAASAPDRPHSMGFRIDQH